MNCEELEKELRRIRDEIMNVAVDSSVDESTIAIVAGLMRQAQISLLGAANYLEYQRLKMEAK